MLTAAIFIIGEMSGTGINKIISALIGYIRTLNTKGNKCVKHVSLC